MADELIELERIGFDANFRSQLAALSGVLVAARVAIAHGESYVVWTDRGPRKAVLVGRRIADWHAALDRPQVGDWIAGTYSDSASALLIEHVLARRTCLVRSAAGTRVEAQVMAANVDVVGIVSALGSRRGTGDRHLINERRLQRYLTAVNDSGAEPILIVNKIDLSDDSASTGEALNRLFPGIPVVLMSAAKRLHLDALAPWLLPGHTLGLIGMSGVGKSTLVNALLNRPAQRTREVRENDARGRHTTTHRELFALASGALLIDMPGTREFGVWGSEPARRRRRH